MNNQLAIDVGQQLKGLGPLGLEGTLAGAGPSVFNAFLTSAIGLMTIIASIWFIFLMIIGAIGIMAAGGDKAAIETGRKRITTGIVGLVIVLAAIFIVGLIGYIFGLEYILDPGGYIEDLRP